MIKHYVEFLLPGILFSETSVREIAERDPKKVKLPENSFGFRFFDRTEIVMEGETLQGERKNFSAWYYQGEALTLEKVKEDYGDHATLISNMERNGVQSVVKTRFGQFFPLKEEDEVF